MKLPADFKIPKGFKDSTYDNDQNPSIINEDLGLQIYIDDDLSDERIYGLYSYNEDSDQYEHEFDTNDWNDIEKVINAGAVN